MTRLSLSLFGSYRVTRAGKAVPLGASSKAQALLAYLAVESSLAHPREKLAGLMWPDLPESRARQNLSQAVYLLRHALVDPEAPQHYLIISPHSLKFNTGSDYWLDCSELEGLLEACERHPHPQLVTCPACFERLEQAAALYGGSFLADFSLADVIPFEEWATVWRERLHRKAMRALHLLYKFNEASHILYQLIWHDFCDWYLELTKLHLYRESNQERKDLTQGTFLEVLDAIIRLLHPFMPFITEEIWQQLPHRKENESIMTSEFPKPDQRYDDEVVGDQMGLVMEVTNALRNIRGEMNLPPGEQMTVLFRTKNERLEKRLRENQSFIQFLALIQEFQFGKDLEKPRYSAFTEVREVEIFVPMERSRMEEEAKRLQKEMLLVRCGPMKPLDRAIQLAGGRARIAAALNVEPEAVRQWLARGRLPAKRVLEVAGLVGFQVTPHQLDPALYPHPTDGLPREAAPQ